MRYFTLGVTRLLWMLEYIQIVAAGCARSEPVEIMPPGQFKECSTVYAANKDNTNRGSKTLWSWVCTSLSWTVSYFDKRDVHLNIRYSVERNPYLQPHAAPRAGGSVYTGTTWAKLSHTCAARHCENTPPILTAMKHCNTRIHRTRQEVSNPPGPHHELLSAEFPSRSHRGNSLSPTSVTGRPTPCLRFTTNRDSLSSLFRSFSASQLLSLVCFTRAVDAVFGSISEASERVACSSRWRGLRCQIVSALTRETGGMLLLISISPVLPSATARQNTTTRIGLERGWEMGGARRGGKGE